MRKIIYILSIFLGSHQGFAQTLAGIPLDSDWKKSVYTFSTKNLVHPSWGLAHAERNYLVAQNLATKEGMKLDEEALFAAAFLHDLGGLPPHAKPGVDHAVRSAELAEPLLKDWGFPMNKWATVKEMILGHTYYGPLPASAAARIFRDADILDFLGSVGVARLLAVTQDKEWSDGTLKPTVGTLRSFATDLAGKCFSPEAKRIAEGRRIELVEFLKRLDEQTLQGRAL